MMISRQLDLSICFLKNLVKLERKHNGKIRESHDGKCLRQLSFTSSPEFVHGILLPFQSYVSKKAVNKNKYQTELQLLWDKRTNCYFSYFCKQETDQILLLIIVITDLRVYETDSPYNDTPRYFRPIIIDLLEI